MNSFDKETGIASLQLQSGGITVHTLLQNPNRKQASINAFLGARYSRSSDSVRHIAEEVIENGVDASKRLETIFHGYGHRSVASMAHLFVCMENLPMLMDLKFFGENPLADGQSRSSRYQSFHKATWRSLKEGSTFLRTQYDKLMQMQLDAYNSLYSETYNYLAYFHNIDLKDAPEKGILKALSARTMDTARYLLPLGLNTSFGAIMPASVWSEYIARLRASSQEVEKELGEAIYNLLVGTKDLKEQDYIPEADGLIRHAEANSKREDTIRSLTLLLKGAKRSLVGEEELEYVDKTFSSSYTENTASTLLENLLLLLDPSLGTVDDNLLHNEELWSLLGDIIFSSFDQHNTPGEILEGSLLKFSGYADLGSIKDLNRHRPWTKIIPLLNNEVSIEQELNSSSDLLFSLCPYLGHPDLEPLAKKYSEHFEELYKLLKEFLSLANKELTQAQVREYVRYLLPHAHTTRYEFYGSINQLIYMVNTRIKPGSHISCRKLVYKWAQSLTCKGTVLDNFFISLYKRLDKPDPYSTSEFIDRS